MNCGHKGIKCECGEVDFICKVQTCTEGSCNPGTAVSAWFAAAMTLAQKWCLQCCLNACSNLSITLRKWSVQKRPAEYATKQDNILLHGVSVQRK